MAQRSACVSLAIVAALAFAAPVALAKQPDSKSTRLRPNTAASQNAQKPKPVARRPVTPCSEYGAGFVRMAGSDTCVRIGGSIDAGVGFSR